MNAQKEYFIYLLSCFLSGQTPEGRTADWEEIYKLADIHDVGGIIASQIKLLPDEYKPVGILKSHFNQVIGRTIQSYEKRANALVQVERFLNDNAIKHLFVKGAVISDYYPSKELRTSADIDVIINDISLDSILQLCKSSGFPVLDYVTHTLCVNVCGMSVEIHDDADLLTDYFDDIFASAERKSDYTYSLSDADHLIYVICHLCKHLKYRGAGIRMLTDIDVILRRLIQNGEYDEADIYSRCEKAGILTVAKTLISLCKYWFNTPVNSYVDLSAESELLSLLENVLLDGGSFGYVTSSIPAKYMDVEKDGKFGAFSKIKVLFRMAFPDREYLKICYPYYANNRFLYPVARINRLTDGLFRKRYASVDAIGQLKSNNSSALQIKLINELELNK